MVSIQAFGNELSALIQLIKDHTVFLYVMLRPQAGNIDASMTLFNARFPVLLAAAKDTDLGA